MTGSIIDADVTLFEVGRRLEYSSQRKEKKEFTQAAKKNEQVPHHCKRKGGKEDKDKDGKRQEGQAHRQNANIIL